MGLVSLAELSKQQRELLAQVAFRAARQHAPEWLPDLAAAREEVYPRFGFRRGVELGVTCEFDGVPEDAFMVAVLDPDRRAELRGVARYRPEFS